MSSSRDHAPSTSAATPDGAATEPVYIRQSAEPMTDEESHRWFHGCADEAISKGVTWARYSVHPEIENLRIVEGWLKQPDDQGEIRWALTSEPQPRAPLVSHPIRDEQS
jgi:hypothetical protein